jgi:biopolymer transport protein ExbD
MRFIQPDKEVNKSLNLPLTPMIDVFVNLLCFFLVGGHFRFVERQLESDLPKLAAPSRELIPKLLCETWIRIKNAGTRENPRPLFVVMDKAYTRWQDAEAHLERIIAALPSAKEDPVILAPDLDAEHGWVMKALGACRRLQFQNIEFKR